MACRAWVWVAKCVRSRSSAVRVLEVGIPIFDTIAAQIAKIGSLARVALANDEVTSQGAVGEARIAWIDLDSASRLVEQYRSTVLATSEQNLMLAEASLKSGQANVTVLLNAQRELIDARRTHSAWSRMRRWPASRWSRRWAGPYFLRRRWVRTGEVGLHPSTTSSYDSVADS
jgi:hypothetical protein